MFFFKFTAVYQGEKKRDAGGPNEIVACTTCGGSSGSPCTHSANNGCATETCFVQVRKKGPSTSNTYRKNNRCNC
ncbi:hypothetical protein CVS40_6826 [Lucilia cuprina]|nr:hypothetical protein CVS40_6826 [Lucilia cuprina]